MKRATAIPTLALFLLAGLPVLAQSSAGSAAVGPNSSPNSSPSSAVSQSDPSYLIGPEDLLVISVWKEPDLTETLPVRAGGMISLPLLNDVRAAGLTPMELSSTITDKLKKYVDDPRVTVVVSQMNSQRIYVTGEVLHTGAMTLTPQMTVLQALASAGFTQFANTKGIYVLRTENGAQKKYAVNYKKLVKGQDSAQNIFLKPGDTIVVP